MVKALVWFDDAWVYVKDKQKKVVTKEQAKHEDNMLKHRIKGTASNSSSVKETEYLEAIHYYEDLVSGFKPPKIDGFLSVLKQKGDRLQERKEKLKDRYGDFLDLMSRALRPKNSEDKRIELKVDRTNASYRISSEGNVVFDRKLVQHLRHMSRKEGILRGVVLILPILLEARCRTPELDSGGFPTGKYDQRKERWWIAEQEMLNSLIEYSLSEQGPRKLVRKPKPKKSEAEEQVKETA